MTGLLSSALLALLLLIPARVVIEGVAGQNSVDGMNHDDQNENDRHLNEYVLPIHWWACEVEK